MVTTNDGPMTLEDAQEAIAEIAPRGYYRDKYKRMEQNYLPLLCSALTSIGGVGRVLDIGPGWGTMALWLRSRGWSVAAIDRVPLDSDEGFMTEHFCRDIGLRYDQIDIECGRLVATFHVVLMTQVLPHLRWNPERAIKNASKMVCRDGLFVATALSRDDAPETDAEFDNWRDVPEYDPNVDRPEIDKQPVVCMYDGHALYELLSTHFDWVQTWQPNGCDVTFAQAKYPTDERIWAK